MDDDALAKSCVLFSGGGDRGEFAKCSKLLCKNSKIGFFVSSTSHCQATNQQQTFAHWNDTQKASKARYNREQPHHGPHL